MNKMTNCNENTDTQEQNKNKKLVLDDFYQQLKIILDKDEFDIFKTKSKKKLELIFRNTNLKIQKLLELKNRSVEVIKRLTEEKKNLKEKNQVLKETIIKQLNLEIV
jgi:hypothetical protein